MPRLKGDPPKKRPWEWTLEEIKALEPAEAYRLRRNGELPDINRLQNERIIELLEKQNEMLEFLVAAEYQNAQATEGLMKAFEGKGAAEKTDAFYRQRLLGGPS